MYAGASTAVGVVASILLANKCTLGRGGTTAAQVRLKTDWLSKNDGFPLTYGGFAGPSVP